MQILKETELTQPRVKAQIDVPRNEVNPQDFIGKSLKEFLMQIGQKKVGIMFEEKDYYGSSGISGMASDVNWSVVDREILEITTDDKYVDYRIKTN